MYSKIRILNKGDMKMKVKANENLFNEFEDLSLRIGEMKSIVQNDMEITEEDISDFSERMNEISTRIYDLTYKVVTHINKCNT